ncbi:hypothetical protein V2J09_007493 [Rumex salicifolius]
MGNSTNSDDNKEHASAFAAAPSPSAGDASSQPGPCPYPVGGIILANHKGCFYVAKVKKIELREKKWKFFIHYRYSNNLAGVEKVVSRDSKFATLLFSQVVFAGENFLRQFLGWDEWVGVDRTMECTDENLQKTIILNKKNGTEKNVKAGRKFQSRAEKLVGDTSKKQEGDTPDINQKKKRKRVKEKESTPMEKSTNVFIPPALRKQLIDDFEFVKSGKLVKLPRSPNIDEILIKYRDYRKQKDNVVSGSVEEILSGLHAYFDKALPVLLLYNKERQQYEQATASNVSPSKIYGAEHLLRLFVKLPTLLCNLNIEEDALMQLQQSLQEVLKFLRKNHHNFFLSSYHAPEHSETSPKRDGTPCVVAFQAVDAA